MRLPCGTRAMASGNIRMPAAEGSVTPTRGQDHGDPREGEEQGVASIHAAKVIPTDPVSGSDRRPDVAGDRPAVDVVHDRVRLQGIGHRNRHDDSRDWADKQRRFLPSHQLVSRRAPLNEPGTEGGSDVGWLGTTPLCLGATCPGTSCAPRGCHSLSRVPHRQTGRSD